jgi:hypothetical protein
MLATGGLRSELRGRLELRPEGAVVADRPDRVALEVGAPLRLAVAGDLPPEGPVP